MFWSWTCWQHFHAVVGGRVCWQYTSKYTKGAAGSYAGSSWPAYSQQSKLAVGWREAETRSTFDGVSLWDQNRQSRQKWKWPPLNGVGKSETGTFWCKSQQSKHQRGGQHCCLCFFRSGERKQATKKFFWKYKEYLRLSRFKLKPAAKVKEVQRMRF